MLVLAVCDAVSVVMFIALIFAYFNGPTKLLWMTIVADREYLGILGGMVAFLIGALWIIILSAIFWRLMKYGNYKANGS
jgi:hypothetical protein